MTTDPATPSTAGAVATDGRWYIVHTYSGQEDRVQKNLEQRIETMDMGDKILEVVVPTEEEVETTTPDRITLTKFCRRCRRRQDFREKR